jgi:hypothetical protein
MKEISSYEFLKHYQKSIKNEVVGAQLNAHFYIFKKRFLYLLFKLTNH